MSLIKQLWIAIIMVMVMAFAASTVTSVLSARQYLQQQLQVKSGKVKLRRSSRLCCTPT